MKDPKIIFLEERKSEITHDESGNNDSTFLFLLVGVEKNTQMSNTFPRYFTIIQIIITNDDDDMYEGKKD